uniref:Uncharacterized protein n=1 Tax=Globodera rostochiensis TaxID=31243 RepID=A0A914H3X9_GLORO
MEECWIIILVSFFGTNSLDNAEPVQLEKLEELPLQTFDELFVEEWLDKHEAEDLKMPAPTNFGQNVHHQIDRQNTQIGQIEPNLTDHSGQIEPNSTDQNPPLTESDHSDNAKNGEEQKSSNENIAEDERKRKIVAKFHAMKDEFMQKGKYSNKEWVKIETLMRQWAKWKWRLQENEEGNSQAGNNPEPQKTNGQQARQEASHWKTTLQRLYGNQQVIAEELHAELFNLPNVEDSAESLQPFTENLERICLQLNALWSREPNTRPPSPRGSQRKPTAEEHQTESELRSGGSTPRSSEATEVQSKTEELRRTKHGHLREPLEKKKFNE